MKRISFAVAAAALALAGCQPQHYTVEAPPAPPPQPSPQQPGPAPQPPAVTTAGPLTRAGVGPYMDGQETDLRARLKTYGIAVARRGDTLLVTIPSDRLFDRMALGSAGLQLLADLAQVLAHYDHTAIEVNAYTDTTGSAEQNLAVSAKRAKAVAEALGQDGVDPARLSANGLGATNAKVSNGRDPKNRRIELKISPKPQ